MFDLKARNLFVAIKKMFTEQKLSESDIDKLNQIDKTILIGLYNRKFKMKLDECSENPFVIHQINEKILSSSSKRLEENYKYVFKKSFKFLLSKFRKAQKLKCRKFDLEKKFFEYHFRSVCEKKSISMEDFLFLNKENKKGSKG